MGNSLWFAHGQRRALFRRALATVLGEEGNEVVHRLEPRRIDHGAAVAADRDQPGKAQPVEMECQRVGGKAELFGDLAGGHALRPGLDQEAEDFQAVVLGKGRQCGHGGRCFHISANIEMFGKIQGPRSVFPHAKVRRSVRQDEWRQSKWGVADQRRAICLSVARCRRGEGETMTSKVPARHCSSPYWRARLLASVLALIGFFALSAARADEAADFYRGRQVTLYVGFGPGGGYDVYARLLARHIGKYIPGNPNVVVQNLPGAGSLRAANYIFSVAPKDGTAFGLFARDMVQ